MFDAYTVKKVLPRLVIAAILIQLSWFIFTGAIALTNAIAYGVEGLIYAPFEGLGNLGLSEILSYSGGGGGGLFLGLAAGAAVFGTLSLFGGGALLLAGSALLSLAIGFVLILFRQVIIVALLIISPMALVAWILPNTEKFWKLWWESFSKLLIVYPLILGVIAAGRVFAYVVAGADPQSGEGIGNTAVDNVATMVMILIALFGPYLLIPKLFQLAGSAFTALKGLSDSRSAGAFERLRKGRAEKRAHVKDTGQVLKRPKGAIGRRINKISSGTALGIGGAYGFGERGAQGREEQVNRAANALSQDKDFVQATYRDGVRKALQLGSASAARAAGVSEEDIAAANRIGFNNTSRIAAFKLEGANKGRNFTGPNAVDDANAAIREAAAAAGIDEHAFRDEVSYGLRTQGNRFDLGALDQRADPTGRVKSSAEQVAGGLKKASLYQLGNGQPDSVEALVRHAQEQLATGTPAGQQAAAVAYEELDALAKNATGAVRDVADAGLSTLKPAISSYYSGGGTVPVDVWGEVTVPNPPAGAPGHVTTVPVGADVTTKQVVGTRPDSARRVEASKTARKYVAPDPNNI